ncbi:MarR family winged helix-turn-helix transcriptional regulator [Marivivens donghaensis]
MRALMAELGFSPEVVEAMLQFDAANFTWHRIATKGDVPTRILDEIGLDIDPIQFSAMAAINRIKWGIGRDAPEQVTIGALAEEMNIDPSRASRIASDLISRGLVQRQAAQDDGRKSILVLTDEARTAFRQYKEVKWRKQLEIFQGWSDEEIQSFTALYERFVGGLRRIYTESAEN